MCGLFPTRLALSLSILIPLCAPALAESVQAGSRSATPAITEQIDNSRLVPLRGNVRPDLTADRDLGPVEDSVPLRLYMVLQRSPGRQAALENLIERQQQPTAAEYHQWITPQQFGERFGVAEQDIAKISEWLESRGMRVNHVLNNASLIEFSATVGNVREAFGTQLHYFNVAGGKHPALVQEPMIPAAMANVVAGIEGLNKIPEHANHTKTGQAAWDATTHRFKNVATIDSSGARPEYTNPNDGNYDVTPQDFYTIYNVNPIFNAGTKGATATVAVIEESDIEYGTVNGTTGAATGGDVANFRTLFGVPGTLNMHVYHGYGTVTCSDPGIDPAGEGEEGEAALDAEWASALAPAANLIFMSCDNNVDNGIITSEAALIDNNLADVMSLSYGHSELTFSSSQYTTQDTLLAQAATQGQSFIVSAGDSGSDVLDQNTTGTAVAGINVSAYASNPLATTAGGTDFVDLIDQLEGGLNESAYWGATNSQYYADALGYVPETAWNSSCANSIIAVFQGYTGTGDCDSGSAGDLMGNVVGGSGGFSTHYSVPSYQTGITGYSGTMRAQPDISAFAAGGYLGHTLIYCDSYVPANACTSPTTFATSGGTSFVAPQFAGVFGLLVNYTGTRQGLLNPTLYALAKSQFTSSATKTACYSNGTTVNAGVLTSSLPASTCTFNDVTSGNNDVPCQAGSTNCYVAPGGTYGMLSLTGAASLTVAFPSTPGYDETTGIGTLNVSNLFANWYKAYTSTAKVAASATSITSAQSTTLTATVTGGTPAGFTGKAPTIIGTATFKAGTTSIGSCTLSAGTCSASVNGTSLVAGSNSITTTFSGSKTYPASTSSAITVTLTGGTGTPVVTVSPTTLAFGSVTDGTTSPAQTVTVSNTGTGTLNITSVGFLGGAGSLEFAITNNTCGSTLAAGATCTFGVVFEPGSSPGTYGAEVGVTDNAAGSPQYATISGTGVASGTGTVSLSPTSLTFPATTVGASSAPQHVTLTNTGTTAVTISNISVTGINSASFYFINGCSSSLAASANCIVSVYFSPTTTGSQVAGLAFTDSATGSPQTVSLTGTGSASGTGTVSLSATTLNFGSVMVGTSSSSLAVTMTNTGTTAVTVSSVVLGGANASQFVFANTCGTSLAAGANCSIHGHFAPTANGAMAAAITITDTATGSPQSIALTGTGTTPTTVSLSATSLNFGSETVGVSTGSQSVTMTNTGTAALSITSLALTGANASSFVFANTCGTSLAAGANCSIHGHFAPTTTGALTAAITITSSATGSPQAISLSGTGTGTGGSSLTMSPTSLTFGSTNIGSTSPGQVVTISNPTAAAITLTGISFSGANPTDYVVVDNCVATLPASGSCTAMVSLVPLATGTLTSALNFTSSAGNASTTLTGTGIATAALTYSTTSLAFPTTTHGTQSLASIVTVTNSGTTTATFGFVGIGGTYAPDFYQLNSCGTSLAVGATCKFYIIFRPATTGAYSATLELFDNAQSGYQGVTLSGTGN